jgi:uncharacterized protein YjbI with pentapeptide repeats
MSTPKISQDPLYQLLREGKIEEFNARKEAGEVCNLNGCDFSSMDLRGINADGLDFSDCYFRIADLRGIDFRKTQLTGSTIKRAKISGTYFPANLSAAEILLSLEHGTRIRAQKDG